MNVRLARATQENPFEFWVKTSKNGQQRAYYWHGRTFPTPLNDVLLAEANGTAKRVSGSWIDELAAR